MRQAHFIDWGRIDYREAWDKQTVLFRQIIAQKSANRELQEDEQKPTPNYLIFCEHPHTYTLGNAGEEAHLRIAQECLPSIQAQYVRTNRGGDITYHGPGQLVVYPIFDLDNFFTDIGKYMRLLEEAVIKTLHEYDIQGERIPKLTGVWVAQANSPHAKICAMGVKASRWVTMHGIALNVNTDMRYFQHIVPCGIADKGVTSLQQECGREIQMVEVKQKLQKTLVEVFALQLLSPNFTSIQEKS